MQRPACVGAQRARGAAIPCGDAKRGRNSPKMAPKRLLGARLRTSSLHQERCPAGEGAALAGLVPWGRPRRLLPKTRRRWLPPRPLVTPGWGFLGCGEPAVARRRAWRLCGGASICSAPGPAKKREMAPLLAPAAAPGPRAPSASSLLPPAPGGVPTEGGGCRRSPGGLGDVGRWLRLSGSQGIGVGGLFVPRFGGADVVVGALVVLGSLGGGEGLGAVR